MLDLNKKDLEIIIKALNLQKNDIDGYKASYLYRLQNKNDDAAQEHKEYFNRFINECTQESNNIESVINKVEKLLL